jgi:hypothetical protein
MLIATMEWSFEVSAYAGGGVFECKASVTEGMYAPMVRLFNALCVLCFTEALQRKTPPQHA